MPATDFIQAPWAYPLGVSSVLVEPPTEEPLTLDEAKLRAGLDWPAGDPRDALMADFIKAARAKVEQDTGLALLLQTRRVTLNVPGGSLLPPPAQTIPTVSITAEAAPPFIARHDVWWFTEDTAGTYLVVAGWPTPAALRVEAPLLVHAVGLLVAHYATLGRDLASIDESFITPLGYDDAIQPHRLLWVP